MRVNKYAKNIIPFTIILIFIIVILTFLNLKDKTGHSNSNKVSSQTEIKLSLFGVDVKKYRRVSEVVEEFEKRTKDILNLKLNITWIPPEDYKQKLPMWLAAGEEMDLVVDAPWMNLNNLARDGAYLDLEKYFNNSEYPGLNKAFDAEYINNNKLFGKVYGIPITNTFMDMEGIAYRKDLLEKYGMKPISSYEDLYNFLTKVNEKEKDMIPFGAYGKRGFFKLFTEPSERQLEGKVFSFFDYIDVSVAADGKSVAGIAAYGDKDENYKGFDISYGKQYISNYYNNCRRFGKFLAPDILANEGNVGKEAAVHYLTISSFLDAQNQLKARLPNAELEFWPIYKNNQKLEPNSQATDYRAWNFVCIPTSSKKVDKTMGFIDWLFQSQENNDLFNLGVEGVHWSLVEDKKWKIKSDGNSSNDYLFPGYELTWNPFYFRVPYGLPNNIEKYIQYQFKADTFKKTELAGFTFDQNPVKIEVAKCNYISEQYLLPLACGLFDNPDLKLKELNDQLTNSGVDKIKQELKKQINEFLLKK
jgi:putative aldouronate transport system substrate-binding protein